MPLAFTFKTLVLTAATFLLVGPISHASFMNLPKVISGIDLLHGKNIDISSEGTRGLVVVFLSAKCPCSDSHSADLKQLEIKYPEFHFVGVHSNSDESIEDSKNYFSKLALPFPVIQDDKAAIAGQFKALKTPHVFVISPTGEMLYQGGVTDSHVAPAAKKHFLADALEAVRSGKTPQVTQTRTLGCIITR